MTCSCSLNQVIHVFMYYRGSVWLGGAFASEINLQPLAKTRGKFLRIGLIRDFTCP